MAQIETIRWNKVSLGKYARRLLEMFEEKRDIFWCKSCPNTGRKRLIHICRVVINGIFTSISCPECSFE